MQTVRAVFVSDAHLGCRYAQAAALLEFLRESQPEYLYLVGDMIDGWQLRRGWYWTETYSALLQRIRELMREGTQVFYTPGNHDEFLRSYLGRHGGLHLADEFVHTTADLQRVLVIHGDQFDASVRKTRWLSHLGDLAYNVLLGVNVVFNVARRWCGLEYWSLSAAIKRRVKQATCFVGRFEERITSHARELGCDGVICGHIHTPKMARHNGVAYYNTGDWVESCTALIEHRDGTLELVNRPPARRGIAGAARRYSGRLSEGELPLARLLGTGGMPVEPGCQAGGCREPASREPGLPVKACGEQLQNV